MLIGEMLVEEKLITETQLNEILVVQKDLKERQVGKKVGELLLEKGYIDIGAFTRILQRQLQAAGLEGTGTEG